MAAATGHHAHSLNLMACVRESSPQELHADNTDSGRHETSKKRRFHPFRGLRRMFRRKVRQPGGEEELPPVDQPGGDTAPQLDSHRSRSTSELLAGDDLPRRRSGSGLYPVHSGLSVSHDSVFTAEQRSPHSSSEDLDTAQSSSSLSIQQLVPGVRAELFDAVRRRRGRGDTSEDDEDLGLPRSPCNSPTTADVLLEKGLKENPTKSHSTCSDGSLLSMGSSEMDEDSLGQRSGSSSKLSLNDKKTYHDNDLELDLGVSATPLSHSAARHKMAVRPKRTHGAPRRRRIQQIAAGSSLPTTPEVNEELSGRSASPEVRSRQEVTAELSTSDDVDTCVPAWRSATDSTMAPPVSLPPETQLKSASLPPGLALSAGDTPIKLTRSRSNAAYRQVGEVTTAHHYKRTVSASELDSNVAGALASEVLAKSREMFGTVGEEDEDDKSESNTDDKMYQKDKDDKKEESSFFGRLLLRRSGKKKKDKLDDGETSTGNTYFSKQSATDVVAGIPKRIDEKGRYANESTMEYSSNLSSQSSSVRQYTAKGTSRSTAASRQRVEPINLPPSPEPIRKSSVTEATPILPPTSSIPNAAIRNTESETLAGTSPVTRMQISYSVSPPKPTWPEPRSYSSKSPEPSPTSQGSSDKKLMDFTTKSLEQDLTETESKTKLKIAGLSSYQQRITQIGNELEFEEREFNSLINTTEETIIPKVSVKKSRSFRSDIDFLSISPDKPSLPHGIVGGSALSRPSKIQEIDYTEIVRKSEEIIVNNITKSSGNVEDQHIFTSSKTGVSQILNGVEDDEQSIFQASEKTNDISAKHFTKNVYVTSRNIIKENNLENKAVEIPVFKLWQSRQMEPTMKKSASLDSISSFGEVKNSPSQEMLVATKKSSSSDSINSLTQQVTMPVGPSGISITQTVRRQEENRIEPVVSSRNETVKVAVAVQPTPAEVLPSLVVPEPVLPLQQETSKQPDSSRQIMGKVLAEKESATVAAPTSTPTPRLQPVKREIRPLVSPEPQVPEFLRVQLNRVDSKPTVNVVLSTSAVFDMDKNDTPRMMSEKVSRIRNVEEKSVDKQDAEETNANEIIKKESTVSESVSTVALRVVRKPSREEIVTAAKEMSKSTEITPKSIEISSTNKAMQNSETKIANQEQDKVKVDNTPAPIVKSQRSMSTGNAPNQANRKYSVVSISSGNATSPPPSASPSPTAKPVLKKQSGSLDSADTRNAVLKKQKSFDFDNITIVEKQQGTEVATTVQETSYQEVALRKKSLPWEIILKKDDDNAILVERPTSRSESVSSHDGISVETVSHKKTKSREFGSKKEEESTMVATITTTVAITTTERQSSVGDAGDINGSDVVLRKKSLSREIGQRKEEEPELLKVFARRSLKLKDSDSEALGQQVAAKARESQSSTEQQVTKSRDSDKENEGGDSPREERKPIKLVKEPLSESKAHREGGESPMKTPTVGIALNNPRNGVAGGNKYQRSYSSGSTTNNENSGQNNETILAVYQKDNTGSPDKRQRNRTVPESPRMDTNHVGGEKNSHRAWANMYKENSNDLNNSDANAKTILERKNSQADTQNQLTEKEEINVPRFKRIQQRKEEWELRAQQASKKSLP